MCVRVYPVDITSSFSISSFIADNLFLIASSILFRCCFVEYVRRIINAETTTISSITLTLFVCYPYFLFFFLLLFLFVCVYIYRRTFFFLSRRCSREIKKNTKKKGVSFMLRRTMWRTNGCIISHEFINK